MSSASRSGRIARFSNRAAGRRWISVPTGKVHAAIYKASGGRLLRGWFGAPVVVIETVGRRTGEPRATPVLALRTDGGFVVMAANAGLDRTPAWWLNLRAAGNGTVVRKGVRQPIRPRQLTGSEYDETLERFLEMYPPAAHYPNYTERSLPLVLLEPAENETGTEGQK